MSVVRARFYTAGNSRVARRLAVLTLLTHAAVGCASINVPLPGLMSSTSPASPPAAELTTASVPAPRVASQTLPPPRAMPAVVRVGLSEEERTIVAAAVQSAALDQSRAATMPWLDQRSGVGGVVTPVGSPTRQGEAVCRAVLISVQRGQDVSQMQANACRAPGHAWSIVDLRPFMGTT